MHKAYLSRSTRIAALLISAAALVLSACSSSGSPTRTVTKTQPGGQVTTATSGAATSTSASPKPTKPVHIKVLNADGVQYGVGMPVIAFFSKKITSGKAMQDATTATVNGNPIKGAWYFEYSSYYKGYPIEAHWRPHLSAVIGIFQAAGATSGTEQKIPELVRFIHDAGRVPVQRDTLYNELRRW